MIKCFCSTVVYDASNLDPHLLTCTQHVISLLAVFFSSRVHNKLSSEPSGNACVAVLLGEEHRPAKWPLKNQPISASPL